VFQRKQFFYGRAIYSEVKDLTWVRPDGREMTPDDWNNGLTRCLGLRLGGDTIEDVDDRGERLVDDTYLILLNAHWEPLPFVLPAHRRGVRWEPVFDTREPTGRLRGPLLRGGHNYQLEARSVAAFRLARPRRASRFADA
jgi:glycogen operon protein